MKTPNKPEPKKTVWLITFTDAIALMLTFFVLLFAMATPEKEFWTDMSSTLFRDATQISVDELRDQGPVNSINLGRVEEERSLSIDYLYGLLGEQLQENNVLKDVVITNLGDAVAVSLPSEFLFKAGGDSINTDKKVIFETLSLVLSGIRNRVVVQGHTDPTPLSRNAKYISNWGLSTARALSVAKSLDDAGYKKQITVKGFGEGQFVTLPENMGQDQRYALSRRVDILILDNNGSIIEPF